MRPSRPPRNRGDGEPADTDSSIAVHGPLVASANRYQTGKGGILSDKAIMFRGSRTRQSRGDPPGAVSPYPHPPLQPLPPPPATPQQPSLLAQMASTAAGVAIGSSVGHVVGNVLTGALKGGSGSEATEAQHSEALSQAGGDGGRDTPAEGQCLWELRQFMECAQGQRDPALCASLGEALRHCKLGHGLT
ncbi:coiled-coil-helix-coiled-coil-helix domain-containing protein 2-like [Petromyzon marinus]|uniref:Coiled-coil-helix-coiled-coil-helix domain-containing protein 10, mitochondrial-like n=1 Tax=Petromyzon marinus TaxID=7757 RepID=A0AAJ7WMN4_PETMA|nr:coiled-coil-helix-coiled-coil-helix domain-containing protein 10, mitochondrial-like [Petromyzon marinus]